MTTLTEAASPLLLARKLSVTLHRQPSERANPFDPSPSTDATAPPARMASVVG